MRKTTYGGLVLALGLLSGCGKKAEERKQPVIGPAPGQAAAPAESTADAPDKTAIDSAARDSLQRTAPPTSDTVSGRGAPADTAR